jgi:hypothetical protein
MAILTAHASSAEIEEKTDCRRDVSALVRFAGLRVVGVSSERKLVYAHTAQSEEAAH